MTLRLSHVHRVKLDISVLEVLEDPERQGLTVVCNDRNLEVLAQFLQGLGSVLTHRDQLVDAVVGCVHLPLVATSVNRMHVAEDTLKMNDDQQIILMRAAPFEAETLGTREKTRRGLSDRLEIGDRC